MTDLNEMWVELERYQPFAEKRGFGDAWLRMTTERTEKAAHVAADAAGDAARAAAWYAAWAVWDGAYFPLQGCGRAIDSIREAIEGEELL